MINPLDILQKCSRKYLDRRFISTFTAAQLVGSILMKQLVRNAKSVNYSKTSHKMSLTVEGVVTKNSSLAGEFGGPFATTGNLRVCAVNNGITLRCETAAISGKGNHTFTFTEPSIDQIIVQFPHGTSAQLTREINLGVKAYKVVVDVNFTRYDVNCQEVQPQLLMCDVKWACEIKIKAYYKKTEELKV